MSRRENESIEVTIDDADFLLTPTGAGAVLGITGPAVVALADRGRIRCVRDSSKRRLFAKRDVKALLRERQGTKRRTPRTANANGGSGNTSEE